MKIISIRKNIPIMILYEKIQEKDSHPLSDRSSIFDRGLDMVIKNKPDLKHLSKIKINGMRIAADFPDFIQIKADEKKLTNVVSMIKESFPNLTIVQMPYLVKLVLIYYFTEIEREDDSNNNINILGVAEQMVNIGIDSFVFKKEFDLSDYYQKKKLYELVRKYLEEKNQELNMTLRNQISYDIKKYSDYFNITKYFPERRKTLGTVNIIVISKICAGLIITIAEIEGYNLDNILENIKKDIDWA